MQSRQPIIFLSSSSRIAFLFLVIVFTTATFSATYGGNESDRLALLSFKSMINHDPYGVLNSWNTSVHFCDWSGVSCGKKHKRVTYLELKSQGLDGYLSPHVGNLSFLRVLQLSNNSFQGTIPHELGRLARLRFLSLIYNKFDGVIPTNLSSCSNLILLALGNNNLVGNIPNEVSLLSKLTFFLVFSNELTGGIPSFLGNITSLEMLSLTDTPLGGSVPDTLGHLKRLKYFFSGGCNLHGAIPRSIYNLSLLTNLSLPENHLTGSLPLDIGAMLPNLEFLQLRNNQLTGVLPPSLSNCSKLQILEMSDNAFSGKLTIDFGKLGNITEILIGNNTYGHGEADQMKFIDSLQNCSRLETLDLRNCNFQGVLPRSIGNLSHQLRFLVLQENQLHGNLPPDIGNLVSMSTLGLGNNRFTGTIPSTFGLLKKLQTVSLYINQFSGRIPDSIGNLSMMIKLDLCFNRLEGHIPSSLGNCHNLLQLYLCNNKLNGKIPETLLQLSSLSITLSLSHNQLFGSLPYEVGDLKKLNNLDLSYNNLSGDIPSSLGGCTTLMFLSLEGNLFQGIIPPSLSSLRGLQILDISHNNLSGQIPRFLEEFSLEFVNLSYNYFEGDVPTNGIFANASAFSVKGNGRLCGGLVELGLPKCKETKKHKKRVPLFAIVILAALTLFTILCLVYILHKNKSKDRLSHSSTNGQFLKVSYNQLLKATNGFSEANLIGKGEFSSVYKGIIENDDRFVAVKVLYLQNQGAHRSFTRECEAWRSIRHRNLLKIITSCSGVDFRGNDFKALVYEFMPNGSLYDLLHSSEPTCKLSLLQRLKILIDVASALDYLHNECPTTILHCDLKTSNVLLDDDMVAHVGDFGLARFLGADSNQNSSTGFKGTIGYVPPEYGLGSEMTSRGDVYSFGILLLEVMTGKKPTDNIFSEGLSLHKFVELALPDHLIDVIDGDAIVMQSTEANAQKMEECLASTVKVGVSCSMDSPQQRMDIKNVVQELQHILDTLQNI